jgi:hypothetical protein
MKYIFLVLGCIILLFPFSCNEDNNSQDSPDEKAVKELTIMWNDYLVKKDLNSLSGLYADQVSLYGTIVSKVELVKSKETFFQKYPDFSQSITGEIDLIPYNSQKYISLFPKRTTYNGNTIDVQGRLTFEKMAGQWKISSESDDVTENKQSEEKKSNEKQINNCLDVVMKIVTTSPLYLKKTKGLNDAVVKNGGTGFGLMLEASPDPETDGASEFSETYDINLHESYPDRMVVIARFTFNPKEKQLYEYDEIEDKYTPIEFDKELMPHIEWYCK